jgi:hypothetical protein
MVRGGTLSAVLVALSLAGVAGAQDKGALPPQEKYGLRLQYREFRPSLTGDAAKASGDTEGSTVDVTSDLGLADKRTFDLRATLQFKKGWKLRGSYTPFDYRGDVEIDRAFNYGDTRYGRFDHVVSSMKGAYYSADLEVDVVKGRHGFLGAVLGAKLFDVDAVLVNASANAREVDTITAPIPVIGLATRVYTGRLSVEGEIAGLSVGSRGSMLEAEASVRLHISDRLAAMGGYRHLSLDGKDKLDHVNLKLGGFEFGLEISL